MGSVELKVGDIAYVQDATVIHIFEIESVEGDTLRAAPGSIVTVRKGEGCLDIRNLYVYASFIRAISCLAEYEILEIYNTCKTV